MFQIYENHFIKCISSNADTIIVMNHHHPPYIINLTEFVDSDVCCSGLSNPNLRDKRSRAARSRSRSVSRSPSPDKPRDGGDDDSSILAQIRPSEDDVDESQQSSTSHLNSGGDQMDVSNSLLLSELEWLAGQFAVSVGSSTDVSQRRAHLVAGILGAAGSDDIVKLFSSTKARAKDLPSSSSSFSSSTSRTRSRSRSRRRHRHSRRHSRSPSSSYKSISSSFGSGSSTESSSSSSRGDDRRRSRSRSSSSHRRKHHRRSRSHSRTRSRSRSPRRKHRHSSSSSSSRSRSRSHRRSQSRSHSRDRSPPPAPLSVPDHLAPTYKPVASSEVKKLLRGKYVHIDSLIRQPQSSKNPNESKQISNLGNGVSLHTSSSKSSRIVKEPLDWFETMLSSMLPVQVRLASQAATLDEAKSALASIERYICYSLAAIVYFRKYTFDDAKKYLESHRRTCIDTVTNLAEPDILQLTQLTQLTQLAPFSAPQSVLSNSRTSGSQSNNTHVRGQHVKHGKPYNKADCGKFNSREGCSYPNCVYVHSCRQCGATDHGKSSCPKFIAELKSSKTRK